MSDLKDSIQKMFTEANRFAMYGNVITRIRVQGFRCHNDTLIDIQSPITAFCGQNGTGKSTILQLVAVAYSGNPQPYYIKDFMIVSPLDPTPFKSSATVEFLVWGKRETTRFQENVPETFYAISYQFSRNKRKNRWNGYRNRPIRTVFFAGIGQYLPKIEQHDFIVGKANKLQIDSSNPVSQIVRDWTSKILCLNYDQIISHTVSYSERDIQRIGNITSVHRQGICYSEAHMGYGEGRTQYLINALECLPDRSLVLIEEPETSLHPSAQYRLGSYFVDVVNRKHHQIFLTTHSEFLLHSLPSQSRVYLRKVDEHIEPIPGLSAWQIKSLLAEGNVKALDILVEDNVAEAIVKEFIRLVDVAFLEAVKIHIAGSCNNISITLRALSEAQLPIIAVLDGDQVPDPKKNILCIPGLRLPPEKVLFLDSNVKHLIRVNYQLNLDDFRATLTDIDHHDWFERLSNRINQNQETLIVECAHAYASSHDVEASIFVEQLKGTLK